MLYRIKWAAAGAGSGAETGVAADAGTGAAADKSNVADGVVELVSPVIAMLSDIYHKVERGEIDLYKSE
jgi:hypothetical protein